MQTADLKQTIANVELDNADSVKAVLNELLSLIISHQNTIAFLQRDNKELKEKQDQLDKRMLTSERYSSKNCLIFIGLRLKIHGKLS